MEKIKKIAKYTMNTLSTINALIIGISQVEGITIPYTTQITGILGVICGVIGASLLTNKAVSETKKTDDIEVL